MKTITKVKRAAKAVKKSKTMIFATTLALFGVFQAQIEEFRILFEDPKVFSAFSIFVASVVAWLRIKTTTGLLDKVDSEEIDRVSESTSIAENPDEK